jgi:hypothetical protein
MATAVDVFRKLRREVFAVVSGIAELSINLFPKPHLPRTQIGLDQAMLPFV